jgi:uncharacterized protein (DUF2237 family)
MTEDFLEFSSSRGNDLSTPIPEWGFPGLSLETNGACARFGGLKRFKRMQRHL